MQGALLFCRLVAGFFGSPVLATGGATLQDIYSPVKSSNAIGTSRLVLSTLTLAAIWGMAAVASVAAIAPALTLTVARRLVLSSADSRRKLSAGAGPSGR